MVGLICGNMGNLGATLIPQTHYVFKPLSKQFCFVCNIECNILLKEATAIREDCFHEIMLNV